MEQIVDNVVRYGRVADPEYTDANVEGVRKLLQAIKGDKDVEATTHWDGRREGIRRLHICRAELNRVLMGNYVCTNQACEESM